MTLAPNSIVGEINKEKRHLVIIDDQPAMLGRFVKNFEAQGYRVTGVLVAHPENDRFFVNGRIDKQALADDIETSKAQDNAWSIRRHREDLPKFDYGVTSKSELRKLLLELKPDLILSDERMRLDRKNTADEETMRRDDNVVRGTDVMHMAAELFPNAPRAIHTAIYDANFKPVPREQEQKARAEGYGFFAKDDYEDAEQPQAARIGKYFKDQFARGEIPPPP